MPVVKLTKCIVDGIGPDDRPRYHYDSDLPGFFLRVMPSGAKAWGVEYRAGSGRAAPKRRVTIASFGKVTPDEARSAARNILADATKGNDPARRKAARGKELTVASLIELYANEGCFIQRGARRGEPMKERTKAYTLARLRHHVLPLLGRKLISDVCASDIERFVRDVSAGRTATDTRYASRKRVIVRGGDGAARKAVRDLSAVYSFAIRCGHVKDNPCDVAAIRKTDNKRTGYLSLEDIRRLGAAFASLENDGVNAKALNIARLWALTGCRRDEIAGLLWSEVDIPNSLLCLQDSKTGRSVRPLGSAAAALIASIPRDHSSAFVFPAERGFGHYQGTKRIWPRVVERAKLPGLTPHTLRHTMGSIAVSSGEGLSLTGSILGHANARSTSLYAHVQRDPSRLAANRVSTVISDAMNGNSPSAIAPVKD